MQNIPLTGEVSVIKGLDGKVCNELVELITLPNGFPSKGLLPSGSVAVLSPIACVQG